MSVVAPKTPPPSEASAIKRLSALSGCQWLNIEAAAKRATDTRGRIRDEIVKRNLVPADAALVVFGSVARGEETKGSDCDWTLLIDGQANGDHLEAAQGIRHSLESLGLKQPGPTELFGGLAFSHSLVHEIGGEEDTNRNTTRRILLLLESSAIEAGQSVLVRQRVVRQVLRRYLLNEPDLKGADGQRRYPRFLLNDVIRYWRTIAVDYARKVRERESKGWALRNIKLRLSRKLIFVSGLLSCFGAKFKPRSSPESSLFDDPSFRWVPVLEHLRQDTETPALEILASAIIDYGIDDNRRRELSTKLLEPYDSFLNLLNDDAKRQSLAGLAPGDADTNKVFGDARELGRRFQRGLLDLFFESDPELGNATQEYGVF